MKRKQKRLIRILAIVLVVLLAGSAIVSAVISIAGAEEMIFSDRNSNTMKIEYMEQEQALRITQRLVYTNTSSIALDRVVFYVPANMFRRAVAIHYDDTRIESAFPYGYLPGGVDLISVKWNDMPADYGFRDENELNLRVACDIAPGSSGTFEFEYYLLLTLNHAFMGIDNSEWRLSDFYFAPACYEESIHDFVTHTPVAFTYYIYTPACDFDVTIDLPESMIVAAPGDMSSVPSAAGDFVTHTIHAENSHGFSLVFSTDLQIEKCTAGSGVQIRYFHKKKTKAGKVIDHAREAVEICEQLFGNFPTRTLTIVETGTAQDVQVFTGCIWISSAEIKSDSLRHDLRYGIAQQYFGHAAYFEPSTDAWLSDSISEYVAYLITDLIEGHKAYLKELNEHVLPSLRYTIPGGLTVTSDAVLMTEQEYNAIIRDRGTAVFHEMSIDMGTENLIVGLKTFYEMGMVKPVLSEMDLVNALDHATGGHWEKALTDWVFNIGDYVGQELEMLD